MRRGVFLCLTAALLLSCSDKESPTAPNPTIHPSLDVIQDYNASRITTLIRAVEPPTGQLNATEKRWESIQRQMALPDLDAAREQMFALADKAVDFYEKGNLLVPEGEGLPETTEEAVAELVMRLFVFVGMRSIDAAERYPGFYLTITDEFPDFFWTVSDGLDSGFGVTVPGTPTVIVTEHEWAAVVAPAGATAEPVFISIELVDLESCNTNSGLIEAGGCWSINRVPEGAFLEEVTVETCVDPTPVPVEQESLILLHKVEEDTGDITALPWSDPQNINCPPTWPEQGVETAVSQEDDSGSLLASVGSTLARLILPDPLAAWLRKGRPPMGIGGLTGSFTDFFGAVPESAKPNIVSWWSADGHYFDMYGGNHGTELGSVPFVAGVSDSAFSFDGYGSGDQVRMEGISPAIINLQELTVAAWVKLDAEGPADGVQRFVTLSREKAVLRQEGWGPGVTNRMLHFYMHFLPLSTSYNLEHIHVDNAFQTGCYHFFVGTYGQDDYMRAYLDGVEVGANYVPGGTVAPSFGFIAVGSTGGGINPVSEEMDGDIDEVMVFDRALDPSEIQAIYDLGEGNLCTPGSFPMTYPEVTVDPTYVGADPTIVPTLAGAMTLVRPGGTVWMADGTHNVENVTVNKPVTIDEVPGATAVIQNDVERRAIRIGDFGSGVVTIQNLDFVNNVEGGLEGEHRSVSIHANHGWDQVVIQNNTFSSPHTQAVTLVRVDTTHVTGASATIQGNTFTGARWGLISTGTAGSSDPFVTVDNNTFTGHTRGAIDFQLEAYGVVSNNTLTNCGELSCIYISGASRVAVTDNDITDATLHPGGDPGYYHTGIYSSSPTGPISGNTFNGCGWGSCIEVNGFYGADTDVHHNTITGYETHQTEVGILAYGGDFADIGDAYPPTVTITDNVIVGVGSISLDPEDQTNPFYHGGILIRNAYATDISRNQITNAAAGIYMFQNGFVYAGSDNEFDQTLASIRGGANADITMTGNDFTTTIHSIMDNDATLTADLACNWWGNPAGPISNVFPPSVNPIVYWPWTNDAVADGGPGTCYAEANIGGQLLLDGSPIPSATVTAVGPQTLVATTDGNGDYLFYNLLPGTYTVFITPSTGVYPYTSRSVPLAPGESATVDFSGAYYPSVGTSGIGSAAYWVVSEPSVATNLCNGEGLSACTANESITLQAVAAGASGTFVPSWNQVHFYFREGPTGVYRHVALGSGPVVTDTGSGPDGRQYRWTATLDIDGLEIPPGGIEVIAIGVDSSDNTYHTPAVNGNITVVDGAIGGED